MPLSMRQKKSPQEARQDVLCTTERRSRDHDAVEVKYNMIRITDYDASLLV